jgi:hypothetical protein
VFKTINVRGDVITLFLQRILQDRVAFRLLRCCSICALSKRLLAQQQRLLRRTSPFPYGGAIQTVADLL